jgi:DUF971 family protein
MGSRIMRLEPTNIQQIGDELAIAWSDGKESFLNLEKSFQLTGFDLVGGYALQPRWADGHSSGIYSFTYLRRLEEASR